MEGRRRALIVASGEYENEGLQRLLSPTADAQALAAVLGNPQIGGFDVDIVQNQSAHDIQARIEDLFSEARPDDVLLVHFSCHGLKSEAGELFFAARNTKPNRLASTAVPADFVQRCVRASRCRSIVLFLDCCYGGAFGQGVAVRAGGDLNLLDSFPTGRLGGGRGRAVISASNSVEYAFEGDRLVGDEDLRPSRFTEAVVEGLATGEADRDEDGWVSLNELYDYVFDRVKATSPNQTPSRDIEMQGELYLARSTRRRIRPAAVPAELQAAARDPSMFSRVGAVAELRSRLTGDNLPIAVAARQVLDEIAVNDIDFVAQKAQAALAEARLVVSESPVRFGSVPAGTTPPPRRVALSGAPIAREVTATASDPWIRLQPGEGWIEVSVEPRSPGRLSGAITFTGPAGELVVPVEADVALASPLREPEPAPEAVLPQPPAPPTPAPEAFATEVSAPEASAAEARVAPELVLQPAVAAELPRGLPQGLVLTGLAIMAATTFMTWFNGYLTILTLEWGLKNNGVFLPEYWLILGVLVLAGGCLLLDVQRPSRLGSIGMGLAAGAGFSAPWLAVFAIAYTGSDANAGNYVYFFGALVVLAGVSVWYARARAMPASHPNRRRVVAAGWVVIVVAELIQVGGIGPSGTDTVGLTLNLLYFLSFLALTAVVLGPRLISAPVREAALAAFSAIGVIAVGSVINYLARFTTNEGATITDSSARFALAGVAAVGMWIALSRPRTPD